MSILYTLQLRIVEIKENDMQGFKISTIFDLGMILYKEQ
jgi:hypothetical protein